MDVMHERVAGLDVHKETIVACVRIMAGGKVTRECRTFDTTTAGLDALLSWVAMEATGIYWKPVWNILSDGKFELLVANARHIKNVRVRRVQFLTSSSETVVAYHTLSCRSSPHRVRVGSRPIA